MFKRKEAIDECISTLKSLDDILADLRGELADLTSSISPATESGSGTAGGVSPRKPKAPDYEALRTADDLTKAKRLVGTREKAIENIKGLIAKRKSQS